MYIRMYVCVYTLVVCIDVCVYVCIYVCMYVCIYVCVCVYICRLNILIKHLHTVILKNQIYSQKKNDVTHTDMRHET